MAEAGDEAARQPPAHASRCGDEDDHAGGKQEKPQLLRHDAHAAEQEKRDQQRNASESLPAGARAFEPDEHPRQEKRQIRDVLEDRCGVMAEHREPREERKRRDPQEVRCVQAVEVAGGASQLHGEDDALHDDERVQPASLRSEAVPGLPEQSVYQGVDDGVMVDELSIDRLAHGGVERRCVRLVLVELVERVDGYPGRIHDGDDGRPQDADRHRCERHVARLESQGEPARSADAV